MENRHFKISNHFLIIGLLLFQLPNLFAQQYLFEARDITTDDGLANLFTSSVYRSKKGFVWMGTKYGLNRYDGSSFKLYTREENALFSNEGILKMSEDVEGGLWLFYKDFFSANVTGGIPDERPIYSLDVFNPATGKATPFDVYFSGKAPFGSKNILLPKIIDPKGRTWLYTDKGELYLYDGAFKKIFQHDILFQYITIDSNDKIWAGRGRWLYCFDFFGKKLLQEMLPDQVCGIYPGADGSVWLAALDVHDFKIWHKGTDGGLRQLHLTKNGQPVEPSMDGDFFSYHSQKGFWYVEIDQQLNVFDADGAWLDNLSERLGQGFKAKLQNYFEGDTYLWAATSTGILQTSIKNNPFSLIHKKEQGFSDCRGITESKDGQIYFLNSNLFQYDPKARTYSGLSSKNFAYALTFFDSTLWAGTYSNTSLGRSFDIKGNELYEYPAAPTGSHLAYNLMKSQTPGLLLAGTDKGLLYVDVPNKRLIPFLKYNGFDQLRDSEVKFIHPNKAGIWLATSNGVFLMNEKQGVVRQYNIASGDLPFNIIQHIHEDRDGVFWLATKGGGIIRWQPSMQPGTPSKFTQFTTGKGLSNNFTYCIYEADGKLWIPSDRGLMWMDKKSFQVRTFLKEDGLPHNEFNETAHYQAKDGTLYMGGLGGLIAFHPRSFAGAWTNDTPLDIIGCFLLEGNALEVTDKTNLLKSTGTINIRPSDKFLELHFNLLDFDLQERHHYSYQIEGYSDKWNFINENFIRITNLPYGEYTLRVQGQNSSGGWSERELSIVIKVLKPFYLRWWFFAAMFVLSACAIVAGVRWRVANLEKEREHLESEVEKRTLTIQQQTEKLKALDKAKSRFFANITHEFRTPLTLIIGPVEQVVQEQQPPAIFRRRMQGVLSNAQHLLRLINQLLDLSKLEGGRMKMEVAQGDIVGYTQGLTNYFQPLAQKKELRLSFVAHEDSWETFFDKDKWDKIVYNLLSNAVKFTEHGGIQVSLRSMEKSGQEFVRLDVCDTGIGMEKDQVERIFQRFYQAENAMTNSQSGTGIGLALVKELVELQGGEIWAESEVGKGTSFEIHLPVLEAASAKPLTEGLLLETFPPLIAKDDKIEVAGLPAALNGEEKLELLLVEDNEEMRKYIRYCIDPSKYNITEAANGEEGLEKALALIPDLIISDVMMPKKDGYELTKDIRNHLSTSHIPVILLTAKSTMASRLEGLRRGADAYLTKPFSPQELAVRIEKLIEIRRLSQQRYQNGLAVDNTEAFQEEDEFVVGLRAYILENIDEPNLNGDHIGKHFAMSRVHLHRKLKALTSKPISEFVKTVRLEKAKELLQEGKLNISEITYQTGFSTVSHFSRSFKEAFGKAPSEM